MASSTATVTRSTLLSTSAVMGLPPPPPTTTTTTSRVAALSDAPGITNDDDAGKLSSIVQPDRDSEGTVPHPTFLGGQRYPLGHEERRREMDLATNKRKKRTNQIEYRKYRLTYQACRQLSTNIKLIFIVLSLRVLLLLTSEQSFERLVVLTSSSNRPLEQLVVLTSTTNRAPLVTFVVPSKIRRSLGETLKSLTNQTAENMPWEAIVGVDSVISKISNHTQMKEALRLNDVSEHLSNDPRIKYVLVRTASNNRGRLQNGAGNIRNQIILHHSHPQSKWVAFVDDDDTLHPHYLDYLRQGISQFRYPGASNNGPDIIVFRMKKMANRIIPPSGNSTVLQTGKVGISFAVQRHLFTTHNISFSPSAIEDFELLKESHRQNRSIVLSSCVAYFVRQQPPHATNRTKMCAFVRIKSIQSVPVSQPQTW